MGLHVIFCMHMHRAVSFDPPSEELLEALTVLARYVTAVENPRGRDLPFTPAQPGSAAWLPLSPVQPAASMQVSCMSLKPALPNCMEPKNRSLFLLLVWRMHA